MLDLRCTGYALLRIRFGYTRFAFGFHGSCYTLRLLLYGYGHGFALPLHYTFVHIPARYGCRLHVYGCALLPVLGFYGYARLVALQLFAFILGRITRLRLTHTFSCHTLVRYGYAFRASYRVYLYTHYAAWLFTTVRALRTHVGSCTHFAWLRFWFTTGYTPH